MRCSVRGQRELEKLSKARWQYAGCHVIGFSVMRTLKG